MRAQPINCPVLFQGYFLGESNRSFKELRCHYLRVYVTQQRNLFSCLYVLLQAGGSCYVWSG